MSNPLPTTPYPPLPPVAVNGDALLRFTQEIELRLRELETRFFRPRQHPTADIPR